MTDKELRRLSRSDLLEMLIAQTTETDRLKTRLEQAEAQLRERELAIDKLLCLSTVFLMQQMLRRSSIWRISSG